ncbi:hypothetical protein [Rhizobium grahamii]|uniref:Uncharacterized protein n=1 Tax=Rhizobium grahamii CCGE 502 TaxID=990285 RepID=S3IEC5_9HYPH|nr:hypothetical protein [Rhizobium grahamii]EPE97433.1 hypothetical protein RGCCGE502_15360 [Rhizobium grahamii CCGE 502]
MAAYLLALEVWRKPDEAEGNTRRQRPVRTIASGSKEHWRAQAKPTVITGSEDATINPVLPDGKKVKDWDLH